MITYTILVTNTGNVTVDTIELTDTFTDAQGAALTLTTDPVFGGTTKDNNPGPNNGAAGRLVPGETATYTATYQITQAAIDAGGVKNVALAVGKDPSDVSVSDTSDDGDDGDDNTIDDPTETLLVATPALEVTKTASGTTSLGDVITYTILVTNTGNVTVDTIELTDTFTDAQGAALALTTGPSFVKNSGASAEKTLAPSETATYTATYQITQAAIDAGGVKNVALAVGKDPSDVSVSDTSDDGDDGDDNTIDDPTETLLVATPALEVTKTASGTTSLGDVITYTILVTNTGNVTVDTIELTDTFTDAQGAALTLTTDPVFGGTTKDNNPGPNNGAAGRLVPGETATYTATYQITQAAIDAGGVKNVALAVGKDPSDVSVSDTSDDGDDGDDNTIDDPTETLLVATPALEVTKTALSTGYGVGDVITYTILVTNTGNVTVDTIELTDTFTDAQGAALTLTTDPVFGGTTKDNNPGPNNGAAGRLVPGETATYTATYQITQAAIDAGGVKNVALAVGKDPSDVSVSDTSDDGDDGDDNTIDDPTETLLVATPALEVTKTASGTTSLGDVITYTILVTNTGNVTVDTIELTDTFTDAQGAALALTTGPSFVKNSGASAEKTLAPGETATYTATYQITQAAIDAGGVKNVALAVGKDPSDVSVSDTSDDGDDGDDNTIDDPTETLLVATPELTVTKTALSTGYGVGDVITYTILVTNTGNVTVDTIELTDTFTDAQGAALTLTTDPVFGGTTKDNNPGPNNGAAGRLVPGETATYTATYQITQAAIDAGGVKNVALAVGKDPSDVSVSDTSDDGDDGDDNTIDDPTETLLVATPELTVTKTALSTGYGVGDVITYTILVTNTGNVTVDTIELTDTFTDAQGAALALTTGPSFGGRELGRVVPRRH